MTNELTSSSRIIYLLFVAVIRDLLLPWFCDLLMVLVSDILPRGKGLESRRWITTIYGFHRRDRHGYWIDCIFNQNKCN